MLLRVSHQATSVQHGQVRTETKVAHDQALRPDENSLTQAEVERKGYEPNENGSLHQKASGKAVIGVGVPCAINVSWGAHSHVIYLTQLSTILLPSTMIQPQTS